jgi:hypothetical protein
MKRSTTRMCVLVILGLTMPAAMGNPVPSSDPPRGILELEQAIKSAVKQGPNPDCGALPALLADWGFENLSPGTLRLVRRKMATLEPCIIESQRTAAWFDPNLHREFRKHASAAGKAGMCAVLCERLTPPTEGPAQAPWSKVLAMCAAEVLSDYQDKAVQPLLSALIDSLQGTPGDTLAPGFDTTLSGALARARARIDDPEAGKVMQRDDKKHRHFLRSPSEVAECKLLGLYPRIGDSHPVSVGPGTLKRWFRLLESAPLAKKGSGWISRDRAEHLCIRFRDGVLVHMIVRPSGRIDYGDDYRLQEPMLSLSSPELAADVLALADSLASARSTTVE